MNLITDSLPAIALGADKKPKGIMEEKPRDPNESLFSHGGYAITFGYGIWIGIITLIAFLSVAWMKIGFTLNPVEIRSFFDSCDILVLEEAQAMAFCVLSMSELFHMLAMTDTKHSFVHIFKDKNLLLWVSFFLGLALQFFVIFTPGINTVFQVVPLEGWDFLWLFGLGVSPLILHEIVVFIRFLKNKIFVTEKSN